MNNISIFGATQCGKTTLVGYLISRTLNDVAFNEMVRRNRRLIEKMGLNASSKDLIYSSFVSLDRDEVQREVNKAKNSESSCGKTDRIGTTLRTHRKLIEFGEGFDGNQQRLVMIDTPGMRAEAKERYLGIFEGDIGVCILNIGDLENYMSLGNSLEDSRKKKLLERRLFDPIRFWCAYKSIQNLILVISKIDLVNFEKRRISGAIFFLMNMLKKYDLELSEYNIPVIPISIRLHKSGEYFVRETHNIDCVDTMCRPRCGQALLSMIASMEPPVSAVDQQKELFASISKLCKIKGRKDYALRVKVLRGGIHNDSKITVGPLKDRLDGTTHFITGAIKSLKEEGGSDLASSLGTGCIGGVALPLVYDALYNTQPPSSKLRKLTDYCVLKTCILFSSKALSGNSITLSVPKCELGDNALVAINELLPKESIHFFWLGRQIVAELIELYEDEELCYLTLCPLAQEYRDTIWKFTVPYNQNRELEHFEVLLMLQLRQKVEGQMETVYRNYINFRLCDVHDLSEGKTYTLSLRLENGNIDELYENFKDILTTVTKDYCLDQKQKGIVLTRVTLKNIGLLLKGVRSFLRKNDVVKYTLKIDEWQHEC